MLHRVGKALKLRLLSLQDKYQIIGDVRGRGFMLAIEMVKNRDTREPHRRRRLTCSSERASMDWSCRSLGPIGMSFV